MYDVYLQIMIIYHIHIWIMLDVYIYNLFGWYGIYIFIYYTHITSIVIKYLYIHYVIHLYKFIIFPKNSERNFLPVRTTLKAGIDACTALWRAK